MGVRVAVYGLAQLAQALVQAGDCRHMVGSAIERGGLLLDLLMRGGQLLLCPAGPLCFELDAWGQAPPGERGAGDDQQREAGELGPGLIRSGDHASRSETAAAPSCGSGSAGTGTPSGQR